MLMHLRHLDFRHRVIAVVAAVALGGQALPGILRAQDPPDSDPPPVDGGWPRAYVTRTQAQLLIHQPQVASWNGREQMVAYAAVAYQAPGAARPVMGTLKIEADTSVALEDRLVRFEPLRITETSFAELTKPQIQDLLESVQSGIPDEDRVIGLDRVLAGIDQSQIFPRNVAGVKADPPAIFYSTRPAILVSFDGEPIWSPIKDSELKFAVNTNWDVFHHEPSKVYYLRNDREWLQAADVRGPWAAAGALPASFSKLPDDGNWQDVKAALPATPAKTIPLLFVSTAPAELILIDGAPEYEAVSGTRLQWLSNTESDVFRLGNNGAVYYLVAGRWFSAPSFTGPWTFATPTLPPEFKQISLEHPRSRVLASVPGTPQAIEAVLLAQVPQTARVNRKELKGPDVAYQGQPEFQPISETAVSRAVNTDKDVIKVGDLYYLCFQGIWFVSSSPNGPWEAAETVPAAIYEIPASSPSHHVTYVTVVEDDDDDEWITYAAVAGYSGMMVAWGCAVWGTGWYYPPYAWYGGFYPVYYPFYPTYGYGAWYNPWTGAYGRGAAWYGPYGGAGVGARYNPSTGTYSRGAVAWGPGGARGVAEAYNPRTGAYGRTQQGAGVYGSWGTTSVQRGNQWAQTARVTNRVTDTTTRATRGSGGGAAITRTGPDGNAGIVRTGSGDVYAGRDGNVYRREGDSWQKYENGSWGAVDGAAARERAGTGSTAERGTAGAAPATADTVRQLDRDRAARAEGATRTRDYGTARSSGGARTGGSYRPSGGFRGGGGRRR
jgi:hypothetical protein